MNLSLCIKKISFSLFLLTCAYGLVPIFTHAQSLSPGLSDSDVSVDLSPENPGPNEQVEIDVSSFATDLDSVNISWSVNGKVVQSGTGEKSLTITTGAIGKETDVVITVDSVTGTLEKDVTIIPATVDLIWEADTYTPPFFKGKALFSPQSTVTLIAIPHIVRNGSEVAPANLEYKWSDNGTVLGDQGGYGKDTLTIAGSLIPRPMDITVEATDPNSGSVADGETVLTPQTPFVLLYKNDPLYGVQYEHALQDTYSLTDQEVDVTAVPYYFSAGSMFDSLLTYNWEINGTPIGDGVNSPDKVFRRSGDTLGSANISVAVAQQNAMFQTANNAISIDFTAAPSTSFF